MKQDSTTISWAGGYYDQSVRAHPLLRFVVVRAQVLKQLLNGNIPALYLNFPVIKFAFLNHQFKLIFLNESALNLIKVLVTKLFLQV